MSSHTLDLPRVAPANVQQLLNSHSAELRANAVKKLGYKIANPMSLLGQLAAIGIMPFRTRAVEAYMATKEKKGVYSGTKLVIWSWAIWAVVAGASIYGDFFTKAFKADVNTIGVVLVVSSLASIVGLIILAITSGSEWGTGTRKVWQWVSNDISRYSGVIPDHVLNTALAIREAVPLAAFDIVGLEAGNERNPKVVRDPDPFLRVRLGNESYYVEQWDERDQPRIDEQV